MTRIFISRPLPERVIAEARKHFDVELREKTTAMSPAEMRASLALYDGVLPTLGDLYSKEIFEEGGHRCKLLANFGVGYNHIDVDAARAHGIAVSNTPGAVTDATADIALMLMLMTCRRAGAGERMVRRGDWEGWHPTQMLGLHMSGKTLGIIGMGRIGQAIAKRAHFGFGMKVVFQNRSPKSVEFPAEQLGSIADVAAAADVVVVALPGGAETHHVINADVFAAMKPTAHFVNIARGNIVDEAALVAALEAGQIAGAGLDVYEFEPEVPEALIKRENVTLLPHLGTAALEVREDMGMMAVENLRAFFTGEELPNPV
ncbi:2-hydroxyacid dehydrogenase [Poseidonocella sedimentorum]|uniref:Hydroxypyruvate reductase n=1 Tax=Poseidonocella sedimentorum TaxID=871652 RepID=A0A1I6DYM0_9RHOB|nr:D-glycerate dehydrogenase [Poseidonocella sedimentorum]SFR10422.1 hydroxypyruvate reductase [Poseidonocella sedimentorum]